MSAPIGPGDYVEFIGGSDPGRLSIKTGIEKGDIRRVMAVGEWFGQSWILLCDHPLPPEPFPGWNAHQWRPIYRRSDKILKSVLEPIPAKKKRERA